jgi:hypothetical protein
VETSGRLTKEEILEDNAVNQGTLIGTTGENFLELTSYAGEEPRFDGWFYYYGSRAAVTVTKKVSGVV